MAKTKQDWLKEAQELGLKVTPKNTIAEIKELIAEADPKGKSAKKPEEKTQPKAEVAKAGKRSAKALREEAQQEEKKSTQKSEESVEPKKGPTPIPRPLIERRGKKYKQVAKLIDKDKLYPLPEAVELATKTSTTKFDSSVELHVNLNVDPRQADQNIRSSLILPHGSGKSIKVAVVAPPEKQAAAKEAGADIVGDEEIFEKLSKNQIDFDLLIATPDMMPKLGRFAKLLGPKGLMPNPKSGTVTNNIVKAVKEAKKGRIEYRIDKQGIVHVAVGKVSFGPSKLLDNITAVLESIKSAKPQSVKGAYIKSVSISTTMGPGIKVDLSSLK